MQAFKLLHLNVLGMAKLNITAKEIKNKYSKCVNKLPIQINPILRTWGSTGNYTYIHRMLGRWVPTNCFVFDLAVPSPPHNAPRLHSCMAGIYKST